MLHKAENNSHKVKTLKEVRSKTYKKRTNIRIQTQSFGVLPESALSTLDFNWVSGTDKRPVPEDLKIHTGAYGTKRSEMYKGRPLNLIINILKSIPRPTGRQCKDA